MSNSNPSRFLADATGDFGLTVKAYWGSVVEAFRDESILFDDALGILDKKTVTGTNSHQFLMMADLPQSEEHTPGTELLGQQFEVQDGTITVDTILTSHADVPLDQMLQSHFDIAGKLGPKQGARLARDYDARIFNLGLNTARGTAAYKNGLLVHNGGNVVRDVNATSLAAEYPVTSVGALLFRDRVAELAQLMDEDFVPEDGRILLITPYIRRVLSADPTIYDVRYGQNSNENNLNKRAIGELEGFKVVVAKGRIPSTNISSYTQSKYNVNALHAGTGVPAALAFCSARAGSAAMGVVTLQGINTVMVPDERRNTMFIKSQMLIGAGQLHPWCAGSIEVASA